MPVASHGSAFPPLNGVSGLSFDKFEPRAHILFFKLLKKAPRRDLEHLVGKKSIPGGIEIQVLYARPESSPRQLAFHCRERSFNDSARPLDLSDGMRRFELNPIYAASCLI